MRTVFTLATLVLTTGLLQAQAPLRVIASNGVKTFVEALVPAYEKSSGRKTSITYGTSTTLVKNIVGGERFDVVIATAEAVDQISKAGKVTREPVSVLGRSQVGVGVRQGQRKPRVGTAAEMKQALLNAKGVAYAGNGASRPSIEAMFAREAHRDAIGAFQGANYSATGYYRPQLQCLMFSRADAFCHVCEHAIEEIIDLYSR